MHLSRFRQLVVAYADPNILVTNSFTTRNAFACVASHSPRKVTLLIVEVLFVGMLHEWKTPLGTTF